MIFRWDILAGIYFDGEDEGGAGGDPAANGADGGKPQSLFAQMGGLFEDPKEKEGFEGWSKKYTTDKERAKAFSNMRTSFDQRVALPGADGKPEDWHKLYTRLGKPETPKDYKFDWGETKLDDDMTGRVEAFKAHAHQHNYTQAQFEAGLKFYNEMNARESDAVIEQIEATQAKAIESMRKDWGADFEANVEYARAGGEFLAENHDEFKKFADLTFMGPEGAMRIGDHPVFLKVMAKAGRMLGEDTRARHMERTGEAEDIQAKIRAIEKEAQDAGKLPSAKEYYERLQPLYAKLYPKKHKAGGTF